VALADRQLDTTPTDHHLESIFGGEDKREIRGGNLMDLLVPFFLHQVLEIRIHLFCREVSGLDADDS
jgi:hypothetical protein